MSMSDPIADFLTRIRNACLARKDEVSVPASRLKTKLAEILKNEHFIEDFMLVPDRRQGMLVLKLRYDQAGRPCIKGLRRQSKPGRRIYSSVDKLPRIRNGLGVAILSTSRGIITDGEARKLKVGGEYICSVW
jgi:small subunit ribosomal protein S8